MQIQCLYCKQVLELNEDTLETRKTKTDPRQQMNAHIAACKALGVIKHVPRTRTLFDTLYFDMPADPLQWRTKIQKLIEHHYAQ